MIPSGWFNWGEVDNDMGEELHDAARTFARVIERLTLEGVERDKAYERLYEALGWAMEAARDGE